jgi:predicted NBD/HSP70 family sugar kinase
MSERELRKQGKKSVLGKVWSVLKQTWKACKQDHALGIGLIAVSIIRNGTMLQQVTFYNWITSFTVGTDPLLDLK